MAENGNNDDSAEDSLPPMPKKSWLGRMGKFVALILTELRPGGGAIQWILLLLFLLGLFFVKIVEWQMQLLK